MARNKVEIVNGSTTTVLLDVSGTTATPETVLTGYTFTQADGTQATGTLEPSSGGGAPYFESRGSSIDFCNADTSATYTMYVTCDSTVETAQFAYDGTKWVVSANDEYIAEGQSYARWYADESVFGIEGYNYEGSTFEFKLSNVYCVSSKNDITTYNSTWTRSFYYCFAEGTQILLADGTTKAIENITYDDVLCTWNFDEGKLDARKPCWIAKEAVAPCYWRIELSNGTVLNLVGAKGKSHRLYNATQGKFIYPQDFNEGDITFVEGSEEAVTIVSCEKIYETVKYYNLMTEHDINCFAEGVLTGNRFCNIYPIENMQFVEVNKMLASREDYAGIPDKLFYGLRLAEQPVQDDKPDNVNYYHTMKEHILHNLVEHERDYQGEADYKKWIFKGGDKE